MNKKIIFLLVALLFLGAGCNRTIVYSGGQVYLAGQTVHVDIAADEASRSLGLSGRTELFDNEGMWFEFPTPGQYRFWMKGMLFPIDIIWIQDGQVQDITQNAEVEVGETDDNLTLYNPRIGVDRVLELKAGWVQRYGLRIGDKVEFTSN